MQTCYLKEHCADSGAGRRTRDYPASEAKPSRVRGQVPVRGQQHEGRSGGYGCKDGQHGAPLGRPLGLQSQQATQELNLRSLQPYAQRPDSSEDLPPTQVPVELSLKFKTQAQAQHEVEQQVNSFILSLIFSWFDTRSDGRRNWT